MLDPAILWHWAEFALRWLHVIVGIAWIGSSFYFIALDLGLNRNIPGPADGEEWQVHGGGFYHIQKYMVAPEALPQHLTWFKWEAYSTWLSGAALLAVVYWAGAELTLIDQQKVAWETWQAIAISAASLAVGWVLYDLLCKSPIGENATGLMLLLFVILVAMAWGYDQVFTGRAAMLHLGAFTATVMSANVFFIIIPNQKIVVADLRAGRMPDAKYGKIAKQRSTHNNYLTLPVLFLMLTNHYPLSFATEWNWLIAALVFLMGVTIRHFFNTMHATGRKVWWTWVATAALFLGVVWLSGQGPNKPPDDAASAGMGPAATRYAEADGFHDVVELVVTYCAMCHAAEPAWQGFAMAPKGVVLETPAQIARHGAQIYLQAGASRAMPPGNIAWMEDDARATIVAWHKAAQN